MSYGAGTVDDPCLIKWHVGYDRGRKFTTKLTEATRKKLLEIYPDTVENDTVKKEEQISYYKYYVTKDVHYKFPLWRYPQNVPVIIPIPYKVVLDFTVPKYFLSDGCSGPSTNDDIDEANWLLHDYFYATHKLYDRHEADKCMVHRRWFQYFEVGAIGGIIGLVISETVGHITIDQILRKAWEISGKRGPQLLPENLVAFNDEKC